MSIFKKIRSKGYVTYSLFGIPVWRKNTLTKKIVNKGSYGLLSILEERIGAKIDHKAVLIQHGWTPLGSPPQSDLNSRNNSFMLLWSKRMQDAWKKASNTPSAIAGCPFVHYRRSKDIKQASDAQGTLVYPGHSVPGICPEFDIDRYCEQLKSLPAKFQPVTISLHHDYDILVHGLDKEYEKRGFEVISSNPHLDTPFYEQHYNNLRRFKFTSSNEPGTYMIYAVEMGIPFFIYGDLPTRYNPSKNDDPNLAVGRSSLADYPHGVIAYQLFTQGEMGSITPEQLDYVNSEIGLDDCCSPAELRARLADFCQ